MSNSSLVNIKVPAYNGNYTVGRSGKKIEMITIHHIAGVLTAEQCGKIFQRQGRMASSHYGIGKDGEIGQYVDEENTAWTNSNWTSNCKSVTIETSNSSVGGNYPVSDIVLGKLIELVADIAIRNKITLVRGKTLTLHRMYANTGCPGEYLISKMDYIIKEANKIIGGNSSENNNIPDKNEGIKNKINVKYQAYCNGVWLEDVINYNNINSDGYAGVLGKPMSGLRANTIGTVEEAGELTYRVHTLNGQWHDEVVDRKKDKNGDDHAGILNKAIDGVMIKSSKGNVKYRVHVIGGDWLPWVTGYDVSDSTNGYAGNLGQSVDCIQVFVE